jgi:phage shock protein A
MRTREDIEAYLERLHLPYEAMDGREMWLVRESGRGETIVISISGPLVVCRVKVLELARVRDRDGLFARLLELNATEMLHGAYGVMDDAVVLACTLRLESLDYGELQGTLDDFSIALSKHYEALTAFCHPGLSSQELGGGRPLLASDVGLDFRMGFFSRLAQLIKSNLNDLISKSEDPEKMLNQVIVDMNQQLIEAKKLVAVAIADEKRLEKQFRTEAGVAEEWKRKAMMAVRAGDDDLAKEGLRRRKEHEALAAQLKEQWDKQAAATTQLKAALRALNDKIEEAKRKKNVLIARKRRAEAMKSIQETMSGLSDQSAFETFDRMAQKIDQMESETEATAELSESFSGDVLKQRFEKLEATAGADGDLEALKREMGLLAEEPQVATRVEAAEPESEEVSEEEMAELEAALAELKARER